MILSNSCNACFGLEMCCQMEKLIIRVGSHVMRFIIVEQIVGLNALKSESIFSHDLYDSRNFYFNFRNQMSSGVPIAL